MKVELWENVSVGSAESLLDGDQQGVCILCAQAMSEPVTTVLLIEVGQPIVMRYWYRAHLVCFLDVGAAAYDAIRCMLFSGQQPVSVEQVRQGASA